MSWAHGSTWLAGIPTQKSVKTEKDLCSLNPINSTRPWLPSLFINKAIIIHLQLHAQIIINKIIYIFFLCKKNGKNPALIRKQKRRWDLLICLLSYFNWFQWKHSWKIIKVSCLVGIQKSSIYYTSLSYSFFFFQVLCISFLPFSFTWNLNTLSSNFMGNWLNCLFFLNSSSYTLFLPKIREISFFLSSPF